MKIDLFVINVNILKQNIIQGIHKDLWYKNEFVKLHAFVIKINLCSELNSEVISDIYATTYQNTCIDRQQHQTR